MRKIVAAMAMMLAGATMAGAHVPIHCNTLLETLNDKSKVKHAATLQTLDAYKALMAVLKQGETDADLVNAYNDAVREEATASVAEGELNLALWQCITG